MIDLTVPVLHAATVVGADDGEVLADELADWYVALAPLGVPLTYAPGIAVAARRVPKFPRIYNLTSSSGENANGGEREVTRSVVNPRTANKARRYRIDQLAKWMAVHIVHDDRWTTIGIFQSEANDAGGISRGERDRASEVQLARVEAWMSGRVIEHCSRSDICEAPAVLEEEAQ